MQQKVKRIVYFFAFLIILIVLRVYLFEIYQISQDSMRNTFSGGDRVLILKNLCEIKRNDIVVFKHDGESVIKRCICLPGDTIKIMEGIVYINGVKIDNPESIINKFDEVEDVITSSNIFFQFKSSWSLKNWGPLIVPKKGMKLLLSEENLRSYGAIIEKERILNYGNNIEEINLNNFIFQNDYAFVMGDNRAQSIDSRIFGPIPMKEITGKVIFDF
jgi:signal peptidase I